MRNALGADEMLLI